MKKYLFQPEFSIAGKFALVFTLLSIVITGATGLVVHYQNSRDLIQKEFRLLGQDSLAATLSLKQQVNDYIRDARFLSGVPPISGIIRSRDTGVDPYDNTSLFMWKERLAVIFEQFLRQNPEYFQIRYIGVADNGRELLRVEKTADRITVTPEPELQAKGDTAYFRQAVSLGPSEILLSKINYNREHGRVTSPEIRTLRVALPVFDNTRMFGMIIINVDIGPELDRLEAGSIASEGVYLFNPEGEFLIHPDPEKSFGFETGSSHNIQDDPLIRDIDLGVGRGFSPDPAPRIWAQGENVLAFRRIFLANPETTAGETLLFMLAVSPRAKVLADVRKNQWQSLFFTGALIFLSAVFIVFFSRYFTRPLTRMTRDVMRFRTGGDAPGSPAVRGDEIRVLSTAFDTMTRRIDQSISALESREKRLQSIMNTAVEGLIIINDKGVINDVNPSAQRLFGYTREEMLGQNVSMLMGPPHNSRHDGYLKRYLETGIASIIGKGRHETGMRKDGSNVPVALSISRFEVRGQLYFTGFVRDITKEKEAAEALARAKEKLEERVAERTEQLSLVNAALRLKVGELNALADRLRLFEQVFAQSNEAIVITDDTERIIDVNAAYVSSSGFSRETLIGRTEGLGRSDSHDTAFYEAMWDTIRSKGSWKGEIWDRRNTGEVFPKLLSIFAVTDFVGQPTHYVGLFSDITKLKATEEKLRNMAYYDPLTGLANRELFRVLFQREIDQVLRARTVFALMYLDLDRFKYVNDTYGHAMGDQLLKRVAKRLNNGVRKEDTVARLGGDEFAVLLRGLDCPEAAGRAALKLIRDISRPIHIQDKDLDRELSVGASIGISLCPRDGSDIDTLMKNADMAMYRAKQHRQGRYQFFDPDADC